MYIGCLEVYIQMYIWCAYTGIAGVYRCIYGNKVYIKGINQVCNMMLCHT